MGGGGGGWGGVGGRCNCVTDSGHISRLSVCYSPPPSPPNPSPVLSSAWKVGILTNIHRRELNIWPRALQSLCQLHLIPSPKVWPVPKKCAA